MTLIPNGRVQTNEASPSDTPLLRWVSAGVFLAVLLTGFMGLLSWRTSEHAAEDADWVAHTYAVEAAVENVQHDVLDVENGARTFNATGEDSFLEPYLKGELAIAQDLQMLRHLIVDHRALQALGSLEPQIAAEIEISDSLVASRKQTGTIAATATFLEGKRRMDQVRATFFEMQTEESNILEQRTERKSAAQDLTKVIVLDSALVGAALLLIVGLAIRREIRKSARMRNELRTVNLSLEQRVEERTAEVIGSQNEIKQLNLALEQRVLERTAQLGEANQELESFTYSVAHDLRAPLRHIAGFSGIVMEKFGSTLDAEAKGYLQRIQYGTQKMGQLLDELLNLARVGRQETNQQQVNLNSLVQEVIGILQPETAGRLIEWRASDLGVADCDPILIRQVFQNLISNALKYSRPRALAVIEIGRTSEGGIPAVYVRDNGVGFNMKYADKLFGVFQRLHRAEDFEGTGIGLATVQRIIKKHQGKVWAQAQLDRGATFYFTLRGLQEEKIEPQTAAAGA